MLDPSADRFTVTHLEMIKGIEGHGFYGECVVPIIENTARECELTDRLRDAVARFPKANAVLVRRHGVYVWGKDWIQAKTQAECYDYLFDAAVRMAALGIDASRPPAPMPLTSKEAAAAAANGNGNGHVATDDGAAPAAKRARGGGGGGPLAAAAEGRAPRALVPGGSHRRLPKAIVLDIEGTVAPITFVADVMRPYCSRARLAAYLEPALAGGGGGGAEEKEEARQQAMRDLRLVKQQADEDAAQGLPAVDGVPTPFPDPDAAEPCAAAAALVAAATRWAEAAAAADRKVPALKALQGRVWRLGFQQGDLVAPLFRDVPDALAEWRDRHGIKTYIYSSGSREAQRQFFAHTQVGDLRPYLSGFFDPAAVGGKADPEAYRQIQATIGCDDARADIVFATDAVAEAEAARKAGWRAVLVEREGNAPLSEDVAARFPVVRTMTELLEAAAGDKA
jgi:methylthioribulose 1-phosphate dehydratase / enolase-phosphatase E1